MSRPLIVGFLKARNEIVREGNIYRVVENMERFCDTIVACDDASNDGTRQYLQNKIPRTQLLLVDPDKQDFANELAVKQQMLQMVHGLEPHWVWWQDADEELPDDCVDAFRSFCVNAIHRPQIAWRFHYTQLWRVDGWARTDSGFDDGSFIKLWRWSPELSFAVRDGTHHHQFPQQIADVLGPDGFSEQVGDAPWDVIHWGNWGKNLQFKCIVYSTGLGGVARHRDFEQATFRAVPGGRQSGYPHPFTDVQKERINAMSDMRGLKGAFTVVIPTYNRAKMLPNVLSSLLAQTYKKWVAVVLDDGSTDDTPEVMADWQARDERIFYCRFPEHRGAVWVNEIGMDLACEWTEYWTRLGSDDWFEPQKLEYDAQALAQHPACFGPYRVLRHRDHRLAWELEEVCNPPLVPDELRAAMLMQKKFLVSWANVAARTSVLRDIKKQYGNYCDPQLTNMEDFLVNTRIARHGSFVWRGRKRGGDLIIAPAAHVAKTLAADPGQLEHDAIWRVAVDGASANTTQTGNEDEITRRLIDEENVKWAAKS